MCMKIVNIKKLEYIDPIVFKNQNLVRYTHNSYMSIRKKLIDETNTLEKF